MLPVSICEEARQIAGGAIAELGCPHNTTNHCRNIGHLYSQTDRGVGLPWLFRECG